MVRAFIGASLVVILSVTAFGQSDPPRHLNSQMCMSARGAQAHLCEALFMPEGMKYGMPHCST